MTAPDLPNEIARASLGVTDTDVYVLGAGVKAQIIQIEVTELADLPVRFSLYKDPGSAPHIELANSTPIVARGTRVTPTRWYTYLSTPGNRIYGRKSGAGSAFVILRGSEVPV